MPPPGGRKTSCAKCGLRISASRRDGSRMNRVTSWKRFGLYVATPHSTSLISPSHSSTAGSPYRSRSRSEMTENCTQEFLRVVDDQLRVFREQPRRLRCKHCDAHAVLETLDGAERVEVGRVVAGDERALEPRAVEQRAHGRPLVRAD